MADLDGVGHGTTLAGRYRLEERLHVADGTAMWRAVDTTLDRPVGVRVVGGVATEEVVDAARRASLIEDPRLLRVLDVGTEPLDQHSGETGELTYVVSEFVDGESLASRLARGPMPAAQVRAVVGEAAEALERARAAGLHHECLTPAAVILTSDDSVKVAGLGVDATARPSCPPVSGGPDAAARADAVSLVALVYAGLTGRWPTGDVDGLPHAPVVGGQPAPPADLVPGVPNDLDTLCAVTFGPHEDGPRTPGELAEELAPWGRRDGTRPARPRRHGVGDGDGDGDGEDPRAMRPAGRFPVRLAGTAGAVGAAAAVAATAAGLRPEREEPRTPVPPAGPDPTAGAATPSGTASLPVVQPVDTDDGGWGPGWGTPGDAPEEPGERQGRSTQGKIALAVIAVLVVVGLVFALNSLSSIGGDGGDTNPVAQPTGGTQQQTGTPSPSSEPSTPQSSTSGAAAPTIQGVRTLDPQGDDGTENDDTAPRAIDGDPGTAWESSTYSNAQFGNLKDGVGLVVDLGRPSTLSGVTLTVNGSGGQVEVRSAPGPGLNGSQVLATKDINGGPIEVTLDEPVQTQHVVLWFTRLPETGSGFRVELAEVQVR